MCSEDDTTMLGGNWSKNLDQAAAWRDENVNRHNAVRVERLFGLSTHSTQLSDHHRVSLLFMFASNSTQRKKSKFGLWADGGESSATQRTQNILIHVMTIQFSHRGPAMMDGKRLHKITRTFGRYARALCWSIGRDFCVKFLKGTEVRERARQTVETCFFGLINKRSARNIFFFASWKVSALALNWFCYENVSVLVHATSFCGGFRWEDFSSRQLNRHQVWFHSSRTSVFGFQTVP